MVKIQTMNKFVREQLFQLNCKSFGIIATGGFSIFSNYLLLKRNEPKDWHDFLSIRTHLIKSNIVLDMPTVLVHSIIWYEQNGTMTTSKFESNESSGLKDLSSALNFLLPFS